ncbi:helix-turn-helix domain-containing protein [Streptomyces sp. NPDC001774]
MCHPAWRHARVAAQHLKDLARLRRVRDRIDREYARPLDVDVLARDAGMSPGHLGRLFRQAYGRSPYSYLMARRVEHATVLLRRGDLGVAEVRSLVGCSSPGVFGAHFAERVGMEPGVYRRRAAAGATEAPSRVQPSRGQPSLVRPSHGQPSHGTKRSAEPVSFREAPAALPSLAWHS